MEFINDDYKIIKEIGSGGGGKVYLAYHKNLDKNVVIKIDKRKITTKKELLRREVDVLKNLSHTYIPHVYDFFILDNQVCTVLDYIEGESLDKPLKRGETFSQAQVIAWAIQLLEALDYMHSPIHGDPPRGYVHSDIKPANIMRTPANNICLIDFNIALILGETNIIGCSAGYASPEHYGIQFSYNSTLSDGEKKYFFKKVSMDEPSTDMETESLSSCQNDDLQSTETLITDTLDETQINNPAGRKSVPTSSKMKKVVPDTRSDIYSLGATLYHLLSGKKPDRDAREVVPLSREEFSPLIVDIITKAMNPDPDLRYQTAAEMLQDFLNLRKEDPRVKKFKRRAKIAAAAGMLLFLGGSVTALIGSKRIQVMEQWYKYAEASENALKEGDPPLAVKTALKAFPEQTWPLKQEYIAEAQKALTDALGCYDLVNGYHYHSSILLPAEPYTMKMSPNGKWLVCIYQYEMAVFDVETGGEIARAPVMESALDEVEFITDSVFAYAGADGITVYDIEKKQKKWSGNFATAIAVSGDGKFLAAINRDDSFAAVYNSETGDVTNVIDFGNRHQDVVINDIFINPNNNLLDMNYDGSKIAVSFSDGSLEVFDLLDHEKNIEIFDSSSGYTHFEGGFYENYLAFSVSNSEESIFAAVDVDKAVQVGSFPADDSVYGVEINQSGVCVQIDNLLNRLDLKTGDKTPLVSTKEIFHRYKNNGDNSVISTQDAVYFYDKGANLINSIEIQNSADFLELSEEYAVIGSMNSPRINIVKYETFPEHTVAVYDNAYVHNEARVNTEANSVILFSYKGFRICNLNGDIIAEVSLPDETEVYDQQYKRRDADTVLEVTYNDGTMLVYNAADGSLIDERVNEEVRDDLQETFYTDNYKIVSPLHGEPEVYDIENDRFITTLHSEDFLTYVTQVDDRYLIAQYINTDGYYYGELLNADLEILAELPYLSDVWDSTLYFDLPSGDIRSSEIYDLSKLLVMTGK